MLKGLAIDTAEVLSLLIKRHLKRFGLFLLLLCCIFSYKFRESWMSMDNTDFTDSHNSVGRCKPSDSSTLMTLPNAQKGFNVDLFPYLDSLCLGVDHINMINNTKVLQSKFVFVTAFSDNHHQESLTMFRSFKKVWPNEQLLVYNLGISKSTEAQLQTEFSFAVFKRFPFEKYPRYVRNLAQYRWKPLVIAEVSTQHPRIVWMDTSMVWDSKPKFLELQNAAKFRVLLFDDSSHTILAATNAGMYDYLPGDPDSFRSTRMFSANLIFITVQKRVASEVLRWWVLCALDQYCMAPKGSKLSCNWKETERISYAGCHRFDQSAINILLALSNSYNTSLYTENLDFGRIIRI